jgi:3-hydroxybutyryl-CoA dehydratase
MKRMNVGDRYEEKRTITALEVELFAKLTGDFNPVHFDELAAKAQGFQGRIAHGLLSVSFLSKILGTNFPGPGTIYLEQNARFLKPVYLNSEITLRLEVLSQKEGRPIFTLKTEIFNSSGEILVTGQAVVRMPSS